MSSAGLHAAEEKMRREGVPDAAIATFADQYRQLEAGATGMMPEAELEPVSGLVAADELPEAEAPLDEAVIVKLNGGLGTSMGMTQAKSLIEAKDGHSFLDVVVRQVLELRRRYGARLPLVLMDSFSTREDSLRALERFGGLAADVPLDFVQNKEPKVRADDLAPVEWPANPAQEWCPPGHGDIYTALLTSGMLGTLLERGYRYAFLSNSDNLGAVLEPRILAWLAAEQVPFAMEVVDRTEADRKGGHVARRRDDGQLVLRETAQVPDEDQAAFQDMGRWAYMNTNNLWVDLHALAGLLEANDGVLGLPIIVNRKTVDPGDSSSPAVVQLETAMGAGIGVFAGSRAVHVSRRRFAPVKTTDDLLTLRSDVYVLSADGLVEPNPERSGEAPYVELDPAHYKLLHDFDARFPAGPPSLVACDRFVVRGDVRFGAGVVARGAVEVTGEEVGQRVVQDGAVLGGDYQAS